jgi:antibiotic biosynthesis monooxygenase (ABM) superfamily enzyme
MVLYMIKWDIRPEKTEAYGEWAQKAIKMSLDIPGVVEFRAFRSIIGGNQVVSMYEFESIKTWASWQDNEDFKKHLEEGRNYWTNMSQELLGISPLVPKPIRPYST